MIIDDNKIIEYIKRIKNNKIDNSIKFFVGKSGTLNGVDYYIEVERRVAPDDINDFKSKT